jgi:cell division protein FtsX
MMLKLVIVNLFRNPLRTFLTMASVTVALFLFCALGGVLDTLQESIKVGARSRLVDAQQDLARPVDPDGLPRSASRRCPA